MTLEERRSWLHQLVDRTEDEARLEEAALVLKGEIATLSELTAEQRERLDQAMLDHQTGKTVSYEEMKQRHRQ